MNRFLQYSGRLQISIVTLAELFIWAKRVQASPKRLQGVQDLRNEVQLLPLDEAVAEQFGDLRAPLLDAGLPAPLMDLLIASTALIHNLTVVTHNTKDYAHIPGLTLVDWLVP